MGVADWLKGQTEKPMDVPHSGNKCSGLCREPCGHDGCWQCLAYEAEKTKTTGPFLDVMMKKLEEDLKKATLYSQMKPKPPKLKPDPFKGLDPNGRIEITRALFNKLVERGEDLSVEWDAETGLPTVRDDFFGLTYGLDEFGPAHDVMRDDPDPNATDEDRRAAAELLGKEFESVAG